MNTTGNRLCSFLAGFILLLAPPIATAGFEPDQVVFPLSQWPVDVENVQAAIDTGGTILLKA